MKYCSQCNLTSPIDARYCIECGALFQATIGNTYTLDTITTPMYHKDNDYSISPLITGAVSDRYIELTRDQFYKLRSDPRLYETVDGIYILGYKLVVTDTITDSIPLSFDEHIELLKSRLKKSRY